MIFVDSNIPMYLVGGTHPNKAGSRALVERCLTEGQKLVTDAEVLQEILHRYTALDRRDAIQPAFEALLSIVDEIFPVTLTVVERAKTIILGSVRVSARDAVHIAVMEAHRIQQLLSFDKGFDAFPGLERLT